MNFIKFLLLNVILTFIIFSCVKSGKKNNFKAGKYHSIIKMGGGDLPFELSFEKINENSFLAFAINGKEKLKLDTAFFKNDSLHIPMSIFDSEIIASVNDSMLQGKFYKKDPFKPYSLNFKASLGQSERFAGKGKAKINLTGKWQTLFTGKNDSTDAIGVFEQSGNIINGSFLTSTGDYRFLSGNVYGDSLFLSCFDGTHLYLFKARINEDKITGGYWSGKSRYEVWTATKNENAKLPDPYSLTYLKKGFEKIAFTFPDVNGKPVSLSDEKFKGKVVVIQIMGSWCPNCMDETNFLVPLHRKYKNKGFEIIGLAFEKMPDLKFAAPKLKKMIGRMGIDYPVLLAGKNTDNAASAALPMLNKVMSFPTTIIIDKKGKVREIHTGFNGPGTGIYYEEFTEKFEATINKLLAEPGV